MVEQARARRQVRGRPVLARARCARAAGARLVDPGRPAAGAAAAAGAQVHLGGPCPRRLRPRRKAVVLAERRARFLHGGRDGEGRGLRTVCASTIAYGQRHAVELDGRPPGRRGPGRRAPRRASARPLRLRRIVADRRRPGAEGPRARRARHPVHLRARAQHRVPVARPGLGGSARRLGHLHRRERRRLLRLPGLPAGVHRVVRADGRARDEGRRRRRAVPHPHAAHQPDEGRDHPPGPGARPRLRAHQQLLRPWPRRRARAAAATAACSGPGDSPRPACADPGLEPRSSTEAVTHRDRTHLLHRSRLHRVRRHRGVLVDRRRPARRGARSHGVLPDLRRPAARHGFARRLPGHRRRRSGRWGHRPCRERALAGRGSRVHGRVDWARRFDHMQQHTGQHILSAAFDRLHRARTVGFHLGAVLSTLDLDKVLEPGGDGRRLRPRRTGSSGRTGPCRSGSRRRKRPPSITFRKEPTRSGPLRVIEVEDFDMSACGGTHVARTGQVGVIALRSWEKFRGGMRLEFVCGGRALREFRILRDAVAGSLRFLSVAPPDLPSAIEGAQAENKDLRRTIRDLGERLAVHEAAALVQRARQAGPARVIVEALDGWDQAGLKALASASASQPGVVAALLSEGDPALLVIARAAGRRPGRGGRAQGDGAAVRRERRRQARTRAGRRPDGRRGGHAGRARISSSSRRFGPHLDGPQPHVPDQQAAGRDHLQ
ncbi:MAG: hypothetical protein MZU84_04705 [Sphingobacterium sp.]|nr:hypothetical protein [Sphingobacterium sp.]